MGYTTEFSGELKFKTPLTGPQLAALNSVLGKDRRKIGYTDDSIYEGGKYGSYWYHIDYCLLDDFSGIEWDGTEKAYDMEHIANWLIDKFNLELEGEMLAQGEDHEDRWRLVIKDGHAVKIDFPRIGDKITCPHCEKEFILEK